MCRYAAGGPELWGGYYNAMDSIKIGPKTWQTFRQNLADCGPQAASAGASSPQASHAKPLLASEAGDVAEMGARSSQHSPLS